MAFRRLVVLAITVAAFSLPGFANTFVSTLGAWNGFTAQSFFGMPNSQTYGQVINVPLIDTHLASFQFEMNLPASISFRGEVYAWDGSKASGSSLFQSAPTSTAGTGMQLITFNTGALPLVAGQQYVIFATASFDNVGHSGMGSWGTVTTDPYANGTFVFLNNGTDTSLWTTQNWTVLNPGTDLAFTATFTTPEPATLGLLGASLVALGIVRRRRRP